MIRFRVLIYLAAGLVLVGCGDQVNVGTVVEREYIAAHDEMYFVQQYSGQTCSGQPPVCTPTYIQVPQWHWVGDEWRVRIEGCKAKEDDFEKRTCEETDRRWVNVSEKQYDETQVGDWLEVR